MPRTLVRELEIAVTASRSADFMVGTGTGQWFGAGAVSIYPVLLSVKSPDETDEKLHYY
jgi:hypothetical protein